MSCPKKWPRARGGKVEKKREMRVKHDVTHHDKVLQTRFFMGHDTAAWDAPCVCSQNKKRNRQFLPGITRQYSPRSHYIALALGHWARNNITPSREWQDPIRWMNVWMYSLGLIRNRQRGIDFTELVILRLFPVNPEPRNPNAIQRGLGPIGGSNLTRNEWHIHIVIWMWNSDYCSERSKFISLDLTDPLSNRARG